MGCFSFYCMKQESLRGNSQVRASLPASRPPLIAKLRNKVLVGGLMGALALGVTSDSVGNSRASSGKESETRTVGVHAFPIQTLLAWNAGGIIEEEMFNFAGNGFQTKHGIQITIMVTPKQKECVPEFVSGQGGMLVLFLNHVFENLPGTLQRLGFTAMTREQVMEKLKTLKVAAFSQEKWEENFGKDSRAVGYYSDGVLLIKLADKSTPANIAAAALYDTLVHEILNHLSGGLEGQSHKSRVMHETLTSIITTQLLLKEARIPSRMTLQPNKEGETKAGERDKCNVEWAGDEAFPSYFPLSANDEVQEWIVRVGFTNILNAYLTGNFAEVERKTDSVLGPGAFRKLFPAPDGDTDTLDSDTIESVSSRISKEFLHMSERLPCAAEEPAESPAENSEESVDGGTCGG